MKTLTALCLSVSTGIAFGQVPDESQGLVDAYVADDATANEPYRHTQWEIRYPDYEEFNPYAVRTTTKLPQPEFLITEPMEDRVRQELTEDLQILDSLLSRAISGATGALGFYRQALGVSVDVSPEPRILYIQEFGVVFTYTVNIPVAHQEDKENSAAKATQERETDWQRTRRLLFSPRVSVSRVPEGIYFQSRHVPYSADQVEAIRQQVQTALENVKEIRHWNQSPEDPFDDESAGESRVVVILKSGIDNSVMTFRTTKSAWEGQHPEKAVTVKQFFEVRHANVPRSSSFAPKAVTPYPAQRNKDQYFTPPPQQKPTPHPLPPGARPSATFRESDASTTPVKSPVRTPDQAPAPQADGVSEDVSQ